MNEERILSLYNDIKSEYDVGSLDDFKSYLSDQNNRERFYDSVISSRYDVSSLNEFEDAYGLSQPEQQEELTEEMMETGQREAAPEYAMTEDKFEAEKKKDGESPSQDGVSADVAEIPQAPDFSTYEEEVNQEYEPVAEEPVKKDIFADETKLYEVNENLLIDGSQVSRSEIIRKLNNKDFLKSLESGESSIQIKDDPEMEQYLADRTKGIKKSSIQDGDEIITPDLMSQEEEDVVPYLNYQFGDQGFAFEESGTGDNVVAKALDSEGNVVSEEEFALDLSSRQAGSTIGSIFKEAFTTSADEESNRLKTWLDENQDPVRKVEAQKQEQILKFKDKSQIDKSFKDLASVEDGINESMNGFIAKRSDFDNQIAQFEEEKGRIDRRVELGTITQQEIDAFNARAKDLDAQSAELSEIQKGINASVAESEKRRTLLKKSVGKFAEYQGVLEDQGNPFGAIQMKLATGIGKTGGGNISAWIDVVVEALPEAAVRGVDPNQSLDEAQDELKKQLKAEIVPAVVEGAKEYFGSDVSPEYMEKIDRLSAEGDPLYFAYAAVLGAVESIPAMVAPSPSGKAKAVKGIGKKILAYLTDAGNMVRATSMAAQVSYSIEEEMAKNPAFKDISENEKRMISAPIAIVGGVLENLGFRNIVNKSGVLQDITMAALRKSGKKVTAETFEDLVQKEVKSRAARGGLVLVSGALAEAETGMFQEISEDGLKRVYNAVKGKEMFDVEEGFSKAYFKQVMTATLQEAIGGMALGSIGAISSAANNDYYFDSVSDIDFDLFTKMSENPEFKTSIVTDIKNKINSGEMTAEQGKVELENVEKIQAALNKIPSDYSAANKKKALSLIMRQDAIKRDVAGKDENLTKRQRSEIEKINQMLEDTDQQAFLEKEKQDAIQEPSTEEVDVQEPAEGSEEVGEGDVREDTEEKITVTEETQEVTDETLKDLENVPEPVIRGLAVKNLNGETLTEQEQQVFDANQEAVDQMSSDIEQAAQAKKEGVEVMGQESATQAEQRKKDISFQVKRAKRAISKILPNVEVVVHDTMDSFNAAVPPKGKGNRGAFIGNKIHVNMSNANTRTVSHEVFHAVITRALGGGKLGDKAATQLTNKMLAAVDRGAGNKVLDKIVATKEDGAKLTLRDYMNLFAKGEKEGQGYDISLQSEEQLAELVGFLAENFMELDVNAKTAIKAWIGKLAEKLGINKALGTKIYSREMTDKDAIDLLNTIAGKTAKGEIIKDAKTLDELFKNEDSILEEESGTSSRFQKNEDIARIAEEYISKNNLERLDKLDIKKLDPEYSKKIADIYDSAKDDSNNPEVKKAYKAMADELIDQYDALVDNGYKAKIFEAGVEPYASSKEMLADLKENKRLVVFSTEEGFGEQGITQEKREENPMLADSGRKDVDGKPMLFNDVFRFVHDAFGHGELGNGFGQVGEENAWYVHSQMFSPEARAVMTTETRGQNSWVNFGKHLRREDGSIPKRGDSDFVALQDRPFAPQKNFLFPEEYVLDTPNTSGRFQKDAPIKATVDFRSRTGKAFSVSKEFNNQQHLDNYIKFREKKGDKEVGVTVDEAKEVEAPKPQKRRFAKKAVINIGNSITGETILEIGRLNPIMIGNQEFARMTKVDIPTDNKFSSSERELYTKSIDTAVSEGLGGIVVPKSVFSEVGVDENRFDVKKRGDEFVVTPKKGLVQSARFQNDYIDQTTGWSYLYDKNTVAFKRLEAQGFIKKGMSINDFNLLKMFLHQPDAMFAGQVLNAAGERIVRGKGGMYYPILFHNENLFWASTPDKVNEMVAQLNKMVKDNGGRILMGITTAPPKKLLSSTTGANAMMDIYSNAILDDILGLSSEDVKTNLINAANKHLGMSLTESIKMKEVISKIREELDPEITSFNQRRGFSEQIARDITKEASKSQESLSKFEKFFLEGAKVDFFEMKKKKDGTFPKNALGFKKFMQGISAMMSEPMLKEFYGAQMEAKEKTGHIYGVIEVTGPVKAASVTLIAMNRLTDGQKSAIVKAAMKDGLKLKDRQKSNIKSSVWSMFYTDGMSTKERDNVRKSLGLNFDNNYDKTMSLFAESRGISKKEAIETYAVENYLRKEQPNATGDLADAILAMTENTHESYPMAVQAESGVTLNLFDTAVQWDAVSTDPDPDNNKVMSDKDYDNRVVRNGKETTRQDQLFGRSIGVSKEPLLINTKNLGKEHQVSPKYQAPASTAFTIYDVINELRGKGYTDSAIELFLSREINPDTQKNFTKKEIKDAMAVPIDIENTLPSAFGDVEGGIAQGQKMFTEVMEKVRRSAARMRPANPAKIRAKAHQILMAHPDFDKQSATMKNRLIVGLDSALGTTANKAIQSEISAIKKMIKGGKISLRELKAVQVRLRALIRKELPNNKYSKSVINKLIKMVTDATPETIQKNIDDVTSVINEQRSEIFISDIESILNQKFERSEAGRKKGTKVSVPFAEAISFAKKKLDEIRKVAEDQTKFDKIIDDINQERSSLFEKTDAMTEDDISMILAYDFILEYGATFANEKSDKSTVEGLESSLEAIKDLVNTGRGFMKEQLRLAHQSYLERYYDAFEDMTGIDISEMSEEEADKVLRKYRISRNNKERNTNIIRDGLSSMMKAIVNHVDAKQADLPAFMDILSRGAGKMFEGKLQDLVTQRMNDSTTTFKKGTMEMEALVSSKMEEVFGKDWDRIVSVDNRKYIDTGVEVDGESIIASQNEIYYWYNQAKDPANHPAFEKMWGKDWESKMNQLEELMTPEVKEWADWQVNEFFPKMYERYNQVYKRVYRTNLPWNKNYAGKIYRELGNKEIELDNLQNGYRAALSNGSTKIRVKNNNEISQMDGNYAMGAYIEEMERFRAYQESVRDISKLFADKKIRTVIEEQYGKGFLKLFDDMLKIYLTGNRGEVFRSRLISASSRAFVFAKLGANFSLISKQLTSIPTYANDIGWRNWSKQVGVAFSSPKETKRIAMEIYNNSTLLQDRYKGDFVSVVDIYSKSKDPVVSLGASKDYYLRKMTDFVLKNGMMYTKAGDAAAIFMGGLPNYTYYKSEFKKKNPNATEQQAIDYAIKKFEKDTQGTQQSGDIQSKDYWQTRGDLVKSMIMFQTSPRQYWRKSMSGWRQLYRKMAAMGEGAKSEISTLKEKIKSGDMSVQELKESKERLKSLMASAKSAGKGTVWENLRTVITYRFMMPMLYNYVAMGFPPLWDLDEEEEEQLIASGVMGNLSILFAIGSIANGISNFIQDKPWASNMPMPALFSMASETIKDFEKARRVKDPIKKEQYHNEAIMSLIGNFIPTSNLDKSFGNWYRTATGDQDFNWRKIAAYSDYIADKDSIEEQEAMEELRKAQDKLNKQNDKGGKPQRPQKTQRPQRPQRPQKPRR